MFISVIFIMMLNAIISIMGDAQAEVQQNSEGES